MAPTHFTNLLLVVVVEFAAPFALGLVPRLRLPAVVLEIVAGIAIGPSGLGWVRIDEPVQIFRDRFPDDARLDRGRLDVDPVAARFLGDWYGFAASVLEELRAGAGDEVDPSRVQLWPEHFDFAVELGSAAEGARAGYGLSPGDEHHSEPYLYVVPWVPPAPDELWQATRFQGAELPYQALLEVQDQRATALAFFCDRLRALVV